MLRPPEEIEEYVRFDILDGYTLDESAPDGAKAIFEGWLAGIDEL